MKKILLFAAIALFTIATQNCYSRSITSNFSTLSIDSLPAGSIHIIDGNTSSLAIGDGTSNQALLTSVDLKRLLQMLITKQTSSSDSIVGIMIMQNSNGSDAAIQIENYLNANGFRVGSHGQSQGDPFNGVSVYRNGGPLGIQIIVGNIVPATPADTTK